MLYWRRQQSSTKFVQSSWRLDCWAVVCSVFFFHPSICYFSAPSITSVHPLKVILKPDRLLNRSCKSTAGMQGHMTHDHLNANQPSLFDPLTWCSCCLAASDWPLDFVTWIPLESPTHGPYLLCHCSQSKQSGSSVLFTTLTYTFMIMSMFSLVEA